MAQSLKKLSEIEAKLNTIEASIRQLQVHVTESKTQVAQVKVVVQQEMKQAGDPELFKNVVTALQNDVTKLNQMFSGVMKA